MDILNRFVESYKGMEDREDVEMQSINGWIAGAVAMNGMNLNVEFDLDVGKVKFEFW